MLNEKKLFFFEIKKWIKRIYLKILVVSLNVVFLLMIHRIRRMMKKIKLISVWIKLIEYGRFNPSNILFFLFLLSEGRDPRRRKQKGGAARRVSRANERSGFFLCRGEHRARQKRIYSFVVVYVYVVAIFTVFAIFVFIMFSFYLNNFHTS